MQTKIERQGDNTIFYISGEVDLSNSPKLRSELAKILNGTSSLLIDLSGTNYIDSSGLATLVEAMQIMTKNKGSLKLTGLHGEVKSIFEISRLNDIFTIV